MMNRDMTTRIDRKNQGSSWRGLSLALTILVALTLMTTAAFAHSGGEAYGAARNEASAAADGEDLDLSGLHARNFSELLAREADEAAVAESSQEIAGLHARNFAELLAREADEAAVAESNQELAGLHARNFAELLAREADEAAIAESNQELAGLHARNFAELLAREADEADVEAGVGLTIREFGEECASC